jgi:hypothetical protein
LGVGVERIRLGLGSAPDARDHFLLLRQKKVTKEKATPPSAVGFADSPALLEGPGGCATCRCAASDSARRLPPALLRCSALHMGTRNTQRMLNPLSFVLPWVLGFGVPVGDAEQHRAAGGSRRALSEARRAELRSRPAARSSAGDRAQPGVDSGVAFSLVTFFWPHKRK